MAAKRVPLFDVVAVNFKRKTVRLMATDQSEESADATVKFAIMRRGVDSEFYKVVQAGTYQEGDSYKA